MKQGKLVSMDFSIILAEKEIIGLCASYSP